MIIRGRCIYWTSDAEPRESGSSVVQRETPRIEIGVARREGLELLLG